ncbi:DUF5071 domain-containing protein [Cellulophaga omnivescoria]|uniref:DUF5071 domain-containing protein n=1 Tax=Cellulophaga omnivescoria TaxID=1888890 RepID=UPI0015C56ABF|nr:DUF5071 domain-containing protein [Cellulophaga omnivescoria]WBU88114.1 DUF5071 domain-containing protein [Cellulophaga omnivescoria]
MQPQLPKHKGDTAAVANLNNYSYKQVKPIVPELLTWLQDLNWPVAGPIALYLQSITEHITDDIIVILKGKDEVWKYWLVLVFGTNATAPITPKLMAEFKRIATQPTKAEIAEETQELALEVIKKMNTKT